jgi:hypothetical protein
MHKKIAVTLGGIVVLCVALDAAAQIRELPKEGLESEGITKDILRYEPENEFRRANALGQTSPAPAGTPPGSTDPHNIAGVWVVGPTYTINADGSYTDVELAALKNGTGPGGMSAAGPQAAGASAGANAGGAGRGDGSTPGVGNQGRMTCKPSSPFGFGMPDRIMQVGNVIYFLTDGQRSSNRRIEMNAEHPDNLVPTYAGHSVGHWEGEWLVVDTVALKGSMSIGMFGAGAATAFTPATHVTERIRKTDGNMLLESFVKVEDPALKKPVEARYTAYYRPDLEVHEAPCEEYSDPFDGNYVTTPFAGNATGPDGVPTAADAERLREREQQQKENRK